MTSEKEDSTDMADQEGDLSGTIPMLGAKALRCFFFIWPSKQEKRVNHVFPSKSLLGPSVAKNPPNLGHPGRSLRREFADVRRQDPGISGLSEKFSGAANFRCCQLQKLLLNPINGEHVGLKTPIRIFLAGSCPKELVTGHGGPFHYPEPSRGCQLDNVFI